LGVGYDDPGVAKLVLLDLKSGLADFQQLLNLLLTLRKTARFNGLETDAGLARWL